MCPDGYVYDIEVEENHNYFAEEILVHNCGQYPKPAQRVKKLKELEWRELRNYRFATDTTKTTNSKLPWKNKTTLPKLTQIRDNLHANYMDALFPNDNWMKWEGYNLEDSTQKKRRAIESYLKTKIRESNFRETVSQLLYDYIDYGNVFAEVTYVNQVHTDPYTKEDITTSVTTSGSSILIFS